MLSQAQIQHNMLKLEAIKEGAVQGEGIIERIWQLNGRLQRLEITVGGGLANLKAGQSVLALSNESWQPYLREQWTPVEAPEGQLIIERPSDNLYSPGQLIHMLGPIGKELPWAGGGNKRLLLIAHDSFPTPLLMLAQQAIQQTAEVALVLLGDAAQYPFSGIPAAVEVIGGDHHGGWPDESATLNWADQIFVVADSIFWQDHFTAIHYKVKTARGDLPPNYLFGVFTLPQPCGVGACDACLVRCRTTDRQACTHGPAFDLAEVQLL